MTKATDLDQHSKPDWRNPFGIALVVYYLVMACVGLAIPDDILSANARAREFSDLMASIVPQIDRITALGIKPDVNRFYFSVLWLGSPMILLAVLAFFLSRPYRMYEWKQRGKPKYQSFLFLFGVLVLCGVWPQTLFWVDPSLRLTHSLLANGVGRGLFAQAMWATGPCLILAGTPFAFAAWYINQ
jgi:hypothetical protein